ncbi:MAG: dihydrofolate reductase family protein [Chloroflexota bacterium]|nr:dihydrofolate reductase family protein [Chloroflexota bacterium]
MLDQFSRLDPETPRRVEWQLPTRTEGRAARMKVILMAAVTIDGKIARHEHHFVDWSSKEDKKLFMQTSKRAGVVILGNNTFETFPSPLPGRLHVVLTTNVTDKPQQPGEIEFTDRSPQEIVADLEGRGYTEAVLTGGAQVNALFLAANMVDEIWLTVEPHIFGLGIDLFRGVPFDLRATLLEVRQLNEGGSVLLRYGMIKPDTPTS